ncbi:hypothetical protein ACFRFQ_07735 [Rhodococcus sp. NPDC056743]|uniref:hypothetical protein n=1 Tax=Rhodococcus sp. NPDC056743 TaxID=3345934 RepID=UPI0036735F5C
MSTPEDPTTVLEFLQGSALAAILDLELPEPVENSAIPEFLVAPPGSELPPDAAELIMQGISLPSLPGVDQLFTPLIQLAQSLGSGVFRGVDPVNVLSQASALIDNAAGLSAQGLSSVSQTWSGAGNEAATQINEEAQRSGSELSGRGNAIAQTTAAAAESVQRGNAQLATIAQSFASAVVAAAPIAWTPPGQAMLLAAAAEHLQAAIAAVTATRSEMLAHTATMNSLAGSIPVPAAPISDALAAAAPLARQASQLIEGASGGEATQLQSAVGITQPGPAQTSAAQAATALNSGVDRLWGDKLWGTGSPFAASGAAAPHQLGNTGGAIGSVATARAGSGTFAGAPGGGGIVGPSGIAALQPLSSTRQSSAALPQPGTGGGAVTSSVSGGAMMGGGAGAMGGARGQQEGSRTTPGYLIDVSDNNAVIGELPMVTPPVIGSEDPDQAFFTEL